MKEKSIDEALLVKYLLGELSEEAEARIEKQYFADDDLHEELQAVELDLIDRYIDNELSKETQEKVEKHFLLAPERLQEVKLTRALKDYASRAATAESPDRSKVFQKLRFRLQPLFIPLRFVVASLFVVGLGLLIWRVWFYQSPVSEGMTALKNAYQRERPLEARISGFDYAPWSSNRGSQTVADQKYHNLAASLLLNAVTEKPSSEAHQALGRFYLAGRQIDEAIGEFFEALKSAPANAQLHSDLGAAFLEKGRRDHDAEDFAKALDYVDQALELNPAILEGLFNRALVLQRIGIYPQAQAAWPDYLKQDASSQWANEARQNFEFINGQTSKASQDNPQLLNEFLQAYRMADETKAWDALNLSRDYSGSFIVNELVDSYLQFALAGDREKAGDNRQALSYAGEIEANRSGDHFVSDLAHFYGSLKTSHLQTAAQARQLLKTANSVFSESNRFEEAARVYQNARALFGQIGGVTESLFIESRLGHCYLRQAKPSLALPVFQQLYQVYEKKGYRRLLAQSLFFLADAHTSFSEYSRAIDYNSQALEAFDKMGDKKNMLRVLVQLAEEYRFLGSYKKSLSLLQRGLDLAKENLPSPRDMWGLYFVAAPICDALGLYHAALEYYSEALRLALEIGSPLYTSRSYAEIALLYAKLNNYGEAIQNAEQAYQIGEKISGESVGLNIMAYSSLQLGHIYRLARDFDKALSTYDSVLELYNQLNFQARAYEVHKAKALTFIAQGNDSSAGEELQTAFQLLEDYRSRIYEEGNANSFFEVENDLYDLAVDFEYSRMNDPQKAFDYAEAGRARALLNMIQGSVKVINQQEKVELAISSGSHPLSYAELKNRLPDQSQIVQYSVLSDKIIIWVVSKDRFTHVDVRIASTLLREKVARYLEQVNRPSTKSDQRRSDYARELYDILIGPIESLLESQNLICIVPDKFLNYLCYDALISPTTGRMLIQDYLTVFSPSANLFVTSSEEAQKKADKRMEKLLSVGNPSFDFKVFPLLADLPSAAREAKEIASYYPSPVPVVLTERDAREGRVKREMEHADIIHLALHYVVEKQSPLLSRFVLAKEGDQHIEDSGADGVMQVYEIYGLNLSQARLIVLAACETGIEQYFVGEGAIGAVRPFIAARVPLIVCSLWRVDSDRTTELMINFHKHRKQDGLSTAQALRQAKLDMLNGSEEHFRQPYYWASFVTVGGDASF